MDSLVRTASTTFVVLLSTVYVVHGTPPSEAASVKATRWMRALAAYFVVVVPLAFLRTGRLFRSYYRYKPVSPSNYVRHGDSLDCFDACAPVRA